MCSILFKAKFSVLILLQLNRNFSYILESQFAIWKESHGA